MDPEENELDDKDILSEDIETDSSIVELGRKQYFGKQVEEE